MPFLNWTPMRTSVKNKQFPKILKKIILGVVFDADSRKEIQKIYIQY